MYRFMITMCFCHDHPAMRHVCTKGPDTRCNIARNIARNIRHSTWLHGRNISYNIKRNIWSAVTKLSCDDVYITQSKMASTSSSFHLSLSSFCSYLEEEPSHAALQPSSCRNCSAFRYFQSVSVFLSHD